MLIPAFILYNFVAETDMHPDICIADWYCFRFSSTPYDVKVWMEWGISEKMYIGFILIIVKCSL